MPASIYHITHLSNLTSILAIAGLCSNSMMQQGIGYTNLANQSIPSH
ncbi:DUF4433 domain-containing protein [Phormidium tenue FACHB-886]|nr:DUF4433 domain-containing protein [Phormidium tenue FACHB-886]